MQNTSKTYAPKYLTESRSEKPPSTSKRIATPVTPKPKPKSISKPKLSRSPDLKTIESRSKEVKTKNTSRDGRNMGRVRISDWKIRDEERGLAVDMSKPIFTRPEDWQLRKR